MQPALLLLLLPTVATLQPPICAHKTLPLTRRALFSSLAASSASFTFAGSATAYGFATRPARESTGAAPLVEKEVKPTGLDDAAKAARFGSVPQAPPANKAQEKLAKVKAEAAARAERSR